MRAAVRSLVVAPTRAMKTGIRGRLTAISTALSQSAPATTAMTATGHDDSQEELGQVAGEVAVERIDAGGQERAEPSGVVPLEPRRSERGHVFGGGPPQL